VCTVPTLEEQASGLVASAGGERSAKAVQRDQQHQCWYQRGQNRFASSHHQFDAVTARRFNLISAIFRHSFSFRADALAEKLFHSLSRTPTTKWDPSCNEESPRVECRKA
jgi:hypothetical protein